MVLIIKFLKIFGYKLLGGLRFQRKRSSKVIMDVGTDPDNPSTIFLLELSHVLIREPLNCVGKVNLVSVVLHIVIGFILNVILVVP